jgi:hypothetical protein
MFAALPICDEILVVAPALHRCGTSAADHLIMWIHQNQCALASQVFRPHQTAVTLRVRQLTILAGADRQARAATSAAAPADHLERGIRSSAGVLRDLGSPRDQTLAAMSVNG